MGIWQRKSLLVFCDALALFFAFAAALILKYNSISEHYYRLIPAIMAFTMPLSLFAFHITGLYNRVTRFISVYDLAVLALLVSLVSVLKAAIAALLKADVHLSVFILDWMIFLILTGVVRIAPRLAIHMTEIDQFRKWFFHSAEQPLKRVLIIGAGEAGESVARELKRNLNLSVFVAGFVDDDPGKIGQSIHGYRVLGTCANLDDLVKTYAIDEVFITIPSAGGRELRRIVELCFQAGVRFKTLPGLADICRGKLFGLQLRDIQVEDLLRRPPVQINLDEIAAYVHGKTVLVTGAGGSIGSEICRQLLSFEPVTLLVMGRGENSIFSIMQELQKQPGLSSLTAIFPIIANMQDRERVMQVFRSHRPEIVFHTAGHKHIPLMEENPEEAVKNNISGTKNLADAAIEYGTERFIMISSDQAVNPTAVVGATKRAAELLLQALAGQSSTRFMSIRFGNVIGSRGSLLPILKEQIERGGPLTITHPEMTRYFITVLEASRLVIQAGAFGKGGEVFFMDMGEPTRILDLAENLVKLSGLELGRDIEIRFTGIRPGEKLFEELLKSSEEHTSTPNSCLFIVKPEDINSQAILQNISSLERAATAGQSAKIDVFLQEIIPSYAHNRDMIHKPAAKTAEPEKGNHTLRLV